MTSHIDFNKNTSFIVKGIAILLMIAHHLFSQTTFDQISATPLPQLYLQIGRLGKICVSIYMFVGGYAFLLSKENSCLKRLWHIYKKFITTFFITTIVLLITNKLYVTPFEYIRNALCISWEINGSWWFISTYILYIIFFFILCKPLLKIKVYWQFLILLFCIFILQPFADYIRNVQALNAILRIQLHYFFYYLGFFYLGIIFFHHKLFSFIKKTSLNIILLMMILCGSLCVRIIFNLNCMNYILIPVLIALVCYIPQEEKLLQLLGKYSMSMWLVHMFFIEERYFLQQITILSSPIGVFIIVTLLSLGYAILESYTLTVIKNRIN